MVKRTSSLSPCQLPTITGFFVVAVLITELQSTPLPVPIPFPQAQQIYSSNKCDQGVSCIPNPGNCIANYADGDGCCPVWQCTSKTGGTFTSYGMTRSSDGYGGSVSQIGSSFSTNNGFGGGSSSVSSRIGPVSGFNSNFAFQPLPNPPNIFAYFNSVFPGFFNFPNYNFGYK